MVDLAKLTALAETGRAKMKARPQNDRAGSWFRIENRAATSAEVYVYDEIGAWGVTAADFVSVLNDLDVAELTLRVNSPGGSVFDGVAIYNAIARHPARIVAHVDGVAASAASFIIQAADEIVMETGSRLMAHQAQGGVIGQAQDMREMADLLDQLTNSIAEIYAARSGRPVAEHLAEMKATTWYNAEQAVEAGLADRTSEGASAKREHQPENTAAPAATILNWDSSLFIAAVKEATT